MRLQFQPVVKSWLSVALCAAMTSCINDSGPFEDDGEAGGVAVATQSPMYVSFRLAVQSAGRGGASRGVTPDLPGGVVWADDFQSAGDVPPENLVLQDQFHVAFYNAADGSYVGYLADVLDMSSTGNPEIRGRLCLADANMTLEQLHAMHVKMMITANVAGVTDAMFAGRITQPDAGAGSIRFGSIGQDVAAIPMWGVSTVSMAGIAPGKALNIADPILLLRAMAKIEVCIDRTNTGLDGIKLTAVTISRARMSGYCMPGGWNTAGETSAIDIDGSLRVPGDAAEKPYTTSSVTPGGSSVTFYVPETVNEAGDREIVLTIDYRSGTDMNHGKIRFCRYSDNEPEEGAPLWNIVRNHYYRYQIVSVGSAADELRFRVTVADMEKGGDYVFDY